MKNRNLIIAPKILNILFKIVLPMLLIMWNLNCFSQDSILLFDNSVLQGKVMEVSNTEVKYKKINFAEGPTYITNKYDVAFIKYSNGMVDTFPEVKPWFRDNKKVVYDTVKVINVLNTLQYRNDFELNNKIMPNGGNYVLNGQLYPYRKIGDYLLQKTTDKQIKNLLLEAERNRKMRYWGFAAIPAGVVGIVSTVVENEPMYFLAGGAVALVAVSSSIINHKKQKDNIRKAVKLYNQKF